MNSARGAANADTPADPDTVVATLPNGVRSVLLHLPQRQTLNLSVFVRTGSQHESRRLNGISHVVEHMAFKGTHTRDCQRINLDAERLGAEVNAHTDKDHTAFHIEGLARDSSAFVGMLGDIVLNSTFPEAELERERQVILHEYTEDEEDPVSTAFKLFDRACYGQHPVGQPVIGNRANIERISRADLLDYVRGQYTAGNVVVAAAGAVDPEAFFRDVEAAFGAMPRGEDNTVPDAEFIGGLKMRRQGGGAQTHIVLGWPIPSLRGAPHAAVVAAALLGEGLSSPLLDEIRERRGLAYHTACSADLTPLVGQFVIEASTAPDQVEEFVTAVMKLLHEHAEATDDVGLQRARNQLAVRALRDRERPGRRLETLAQELYTFGHVRPAAQWLEAIEAVTPAQVRDAFAQMLATLPAVALAGKVGAHVSDHVLALANAGRKLPAVRLG